MTIVLSMIGFVIAFAGFFQFRNTWVFRERVKIIRTETYEVYNHLPSYDYMLMRFWIWDIRKFMDERP